MRVPKKVFKDTVVDEEQLDSIIEEINSEGQEIEKEREMNTLPVDMHEQELDSNLLPASYGTLTYFEADLESDKSRTKLIKTIVSLVRGTIEQRELIKFLREEHNQDNCAILSGVTSEDVSIELHHYPFSLYDIVDVMMSYYIATGENFSTISLAEKVCEEHYLGTIGLVPLSETMHQLAHSGELTISLKMVYGDFLKFVKKYRAGVSEELMETLKALIERSSKDEYQIKNKHLIKTKRRIIAYNKEESHIMIDSSILDKEENKTE